MWLLLASPHRGTWPAPQACALTGNRTGDPLVCRLALSPLSHTSQDTVMLNGRGVSVFREEKPSGVDGGGGSTAV